MQKQDTSLRYKNIEKHAYLGWQSKFLEIKKSGIPKSPNQSPFSPVNKICQKSGHGD
jgi:hypothetical protein